MARVLDVYLHDNLVGKLVQDRHGQMSFTYKEEWLNDASSTPLSQSLPLRKEAFKQKQCRGYFAGILPEENIRDTIASKFGISSRNDFAMLEKIGGECAGAVTFMPAGQSLPQGTAHYRPLADKELINIIQTLPSRPLMAGEDCNFQFLGRQ